MKKIRPSILGVCTLFFNALKNNVQTNQTSILTFVLGAGILIFNLNITVEKVLTTFSTIVILEIIMQYYMYGKTSLLSIRYAGVFNALWGISFFLRSDELFIYVFSGILAVLGKYVFTTSEGRHFLNPSNMAVSIILISFPLVTWTNPLQWGKYASELEQVILFILLLLFGSFISYRVLKTIHIPIWLTTIGFAITQIIIFTLFTKNGDLMFYLNSIDGGLHLTHHITYFNPGWLIFIFFMITDPRTNPVTRMGCLLQGISIGTLFFVLQFYINENYSNLLALFIMTFFLPIIWKFEKMEWRFGVSYANILQIILLIILFSLFYYNISVQGYPNLLYNNRCGQLFCL